MPITKINFSTAAAETIGNLPDSSKVTNVDNDTRFLVVEDEETKYTTLSDITSGVLAEGNITSNVTSLRGDITNLQLGLGNANSGIIDLGSQISTINGELVAINGDITDINANVTTLRNGLNSANTNIENLRDKDEEINDIIQGGMNYFTREDNIWAAINDDEDTTFQAGNSVAKNVREIKEDISTIRTTATVHAGTFASTSAAGHVFLASDINDTGNNAVPIASQVKSSLTSLETNLNTHKNTAATASAYGHVKLGTSVQVPSDAGMIGICSNGGLGVRKASSNDTSGVGCVKLALSLNDTRDAVVPTATLVNAAINGADKRLLPADATPAEGEWQALHIPYAALPSWPIERITIPTMLKVQTTPLYMAAYSVSSSGALSRLSVSSNALTWEANSSATWHFETPISLQSGYNLRLFLITDVANATETACTAISEHVKSHYISGGSCEVRYSGVWYGTRTIDIIFSSNGHADILSTTSAPGHVYLATDENDTRANAVPTIAQFKALLDRVTALETALASVTLVTAPETTTT